MTKHKDLNVTVLAYSRFNTFEKVINQCNKNLTKVTVNLDSPENNDVEVEQKKIISLLDRLDIEVELVRRSTNYGLVRSVLTSVEEGLERDDHVIMLEDDCLPSDEFFDFMSSSLKKYANHKSISSVCGTVTDCRFNPWGWATWKNKWKYKNMTIEQILQVQNLSNDLRNFLEQNDVEESIWSLSWLAYQYKNNTCSLFPNKSLVKNIGIKNPGVHCSEKGYTKWLLSQIMN